MLNAQWSAGKFMTLSLDPWPSLIPPAALRVSDFIERIVDATRDVCCGLQINPRFYYDHFGANAHNMIYLIKQHIRQRCSALPIIADIKETDISAGIACSARFWFDQMGFDAVTICPFYGMDAFMPFLEREKKGVIVNCRTSNRDAGEFQDVIIQEAGGAPMPLHRFVAWRASQYWDKNRNCALTIDASHPDDLKQARDIITQAGKPTIPIFIYGSGTQSTGDISENISQAVACGQDQMGSGFSIVVSRTVLYASNGKDYAEAARNSAIKLNGVIAKSRRA